MIFQEKFFSWSVLLTNQISYPDCLLEILVNMCTTILFFPGRDLISFEINIAFLIKPSFYMTKKLKQKLKYLEKEQSF